jgi:hypothetical protein
MNKMSKMSLKAAVRTVKLTNRMTADLDLNMFRPSTIDKSRRTLKGSERNRSGRVLESLHKQFDAMVQDVEFLYRCFSLLDEDDDGSLTVPQLKRWVTVMNDDPDGPGGGAPTPEDMLDLLQVSDRTGVQVARRS